MMPYSGKEPSTLDQLPCSAEAYYRDSVSDPLWNRTFVGMDSCGRRVYQKWIDGEKHGEPRALLTYQEYVRKVKEWAKLSGSIGVQRWTEPYWSETCASG